MRAMLLILLVPALAGCATVGRYANALDPSKNPHRVLHAPDESRDDAISPFARANYAVLQEALTSAENGRENLRRVGSDNMRRYLGAGFALSDIYCEEYFRRTDEAQRRRQFGRSATNDVGTAVSTVLGLASAGENVVTGVAAGFGLLDTTFRNYDDAFVAGPDLAQVRSLVLAAQDDFRARTVATNAVLPADYGTAQTVIMRYANMCSFLGMRSLLNRTSAAAEQRLQQQRQMPTTTSPEPAGPPTNVAPTTLTEGAIPALPANAPQ